MMGLKIRDLREAKNLTQAELAEITGLSDRTISRIEVGRVSPEFGTIEAVANALDITLDYLINDKADISKEIYINEITEKIKRCNVKELKHILAYIEFYNKQENIDNDGK